MGLTIEQFAAKLNGREYRSEMSKAEHNEALSRGFFVIFGASDDLVELRGVIYDEVSAYNGTTFKLTHDQLLVKHECDCEYCGYKTLPSVDVEALWCDDNKHSWIYKTEVPHATFEIIEDGEPYCRGIVIDTRSLPGYVAEAK